MFALHNCYSLVYGQKEKNKQTRTWPAGCPELVSSLTGPSSPLSPPGIHRGHLTVWTPTQPPPGPPSVSWADGSPWDHRKVSPGEGLSLREPGSHTGIRSLCDPGKSLPHSGPRFLWCKMRARERVSHVGLHGPVQSPSRVLRCVLQLWLEQGAGVGGGVVTMLVLPPTVDLGPQRVASEAGVGKLCAGKGTAAL